MSPLPTQISVLVVDDDARVLTALAQTIDREVDLCVVAQARDAATSLTMAARLSPAVVLVDVLLPDAPTGLALISTLSRDHGCAVVAISIEDAQRDPSLDAGAAVFVAKGADIDALLDAIRTASGPASK